MAWLSGRPALPQFRVSKGAPLTIKRRPVLVQSAETLAHVALIARHGPEWFRGVGRPDAPGTCLVTVSGPLANPGVYEVELGTPVTAILERAGIEAPIAAVLVGGYGGHVASLRSVRHSARSRPPRLRWEAPWGRGCSPPLRPRRAELPRRLGLPPTWPARVLDNAVLVSIGLHDMAQDLVQLARGENDSKTLTRLRHRLDMVDGRGACGHPDGVVRLVRSALEVFARDVADHARHRPCQGWNRRPGPAGDPFGGACRRAAVIEAQSMAIVASHYRLRVNPVACDAFGYCAELVPEIIVRDEWGYPVLDGRRHSLALVRVGPAGGAGVPAARPVHREGRRDPPMTELSPRLERKLCPCQR